MIFMTYDPYMDLNLEEYKEICVICLTSDRLINLNTQPYFILSCDCSCLIHLECLDKLYSYHADLYKPCYCPICRKSMLFKNINIPNFIKYSNLIYYYSYMVYVYMFTKIIIAILFALFSFFSYILIIRDSISIFYFFIYNWPQVS